MNVADKITKLNHVRKHWSSFKDVYNAEYVKELEQEIKQELMHENQVSTFDRGMQAANKDALEYILKIEKENPNETAFWLLTKLKIFLKKHSQS